jgi:hypothetical protein
VLWALDRGGLRTASKSDIFRGPHGYIRGYEYIHGYDNEYNNFLVDNIRALGISNANTDTPSLSMNIHEYSWIYTQTHQFRPDLYPAPTPTTTTWNLNASASNLTKVSLPQLPA